MRMDIQVQCLFFLNENVQAKEPFEINTSFFSR